MIRQAFIALSLTLALLQSARAADTAPGAAPARSAVGTAPRQMPAGRFGTATVYVPDGTSRSVAIFVSGDGGWKLGVTDMAKALRDDGAVVIGIDIRRYIASLKASAQKADPVCQSLAGDFETLSHRIQKELGVSEYHVPVLVGYSSGATIVYAALVQSPTGTFEGAMSLGFCADQDFGGAALCPGTGLHYAPGQGKLQKGEWVVDPAKTLKQPWIALQGQKDEVCSPPAVDAFAAQTPMSQVIRLPAVGHGFSVERNWMPQFLEAYRRLNAPQQSRIAARPADIDDLPVTEVRAEGNSDSDTFALLLTGDGGWAGLDQELATRLAADGVSTVGLNSLKYFWSERTPTGAAKDVARVIRHYLAAWNKTRVLLVGYSFGADALPFIVNRLPPDLKSQLLSLSLLGLSANASFQVSVADWIGGDSGGPATQPELTALGAVPVLCLYGEGDKDTICPTANGKITREHIGKGHHFSGEYSQIADRIVAFAKAPPAT
ncbi:MAG TPA: AcvB/VirJ family lysyl-phosphatidylglycerol hydrolase [Steroidobacteraceae bacterium]|jgi:type IV secretory pathway VirJ component